MNRLGDSLGTSLGRKMIVAITGLGLLGFVIVHMLGNLQVFAGQEALNAYAAQLHSLGPVLWVARLGLLAMGAVHIGLALRLAAENKAARPVAYAHQGRVQSTSAARLMTISGLTILAFLLFHLAHFTWGWTHPEHKELVETLADGTTRPDVYSMVVLGFQSPFVSVLYMAAMGLLGWHILHGVQSVAQTLGLQSPKHRDIITKAGYGLAALLVVGNTIMPLACLLRIVDLPDGN
mgnify:CR=1 FL=1